MEKILKSQTRTRGNMSSMYPFFLPGGVFANFPSLITEWRIQKRVEEQFNAFVSGFHELIPQDLVNVFDERELELLIGGIADIDVEDWKKHTDYRGYTESDEVIVNFWKVSLAGICLQFGANASCSVSGAGMLNRSLGCCSLLRVLRVFRSMGSKICKAVTVREDLRLKRLESPINYPSRTHGTYPVSYAILSPYINSYTSFNRLDLPPYKTFDALNNKLTIAVEETVGFGQE